MEKNTLTVSPGKTQGYGNPFHLKITLGAALREPGRPAERILFVRHDSLFDR